MNHTCRWLVLLICLIATAPSGWAKERDVVAILPFSIHSAENIEYVSQGILNMLTSRLSGNEKIVVVDRERVLGSLEGKVGKELSPEATVSLGRKLGADFLVSGVITKIGSSLNIDGKLLDVTGAKAPLIAAIQCQSMDEVIPKITDFARKIDSYLSGAPLPSAATQTSREIVVSRPAAPQPSREAEIISGMRGSKQGTLTASVNPDFINAEQPLNRESFWKSQQLSYEIKGLAIGDVNGDGLNETVVIDQNNVYIYQRRKNDFALVQQIAGRFHHNYIAVDVADVNRNGLKEILVTNQVGMVIETFVIEYRDGRFATIAQDLPWFMRVIDTDSGVPLLLGQRMGIGRVFEKPIHEIVWSDGSYREGRKMRIPEGLPLYGLTIDRITPGGMERVIALNEDDLLCIFELTDKPLSKILVFGGSDELIWKSDDVFGGSNTYIDPGSAKPQGQSSDGTGNTYINLRIVTYDTDRDGKKEIIIVKNHSPVGRLFERLKLFNAAEVYNLSWDATGIVENWRTKKITGYVSDYQFKDIDNDGENEIVLALVLSTGGSLRGRSVVVAYDIQGP
jgi:TolB-like protein